MQVRTCGERVLLQGICVPVGGLRTLSEPHIDPAGLAHGLIAAGLAPSANLEKARDRVTSVGSTTRFAHEATKCRIAPFGRRPARTETYARSRPRRSPECGSGPLQRAGTNEG